jgi:tRNA dimethylallyltransferase
MSEHILPPLVAVVGPTAVGKSALASSLAREFGGEIVCADSRTQYRGMDIGTAKPTALQRSLVPHHLLDMISPDQSFTLAEFQDAALRTLVAITERGHVPFLVGGSGLYVKCVVEGFRIPQMVPDFGFRQSLADDAQRLGAEHLYQQLVCVDPVAASRIGPANVRRIIRALEVFHTLGVPISELQTKTPPPYRVLLIGLTRSMDSLERSIAERVNAMLSEGLVNEVRRLVDQGYGYNLPAMSGIGYREVGMCLRGEITLDAAREMICRNTRRFIRRQYQWFRLSDPHIRWFDLDTPHARDAVRQALQEFGLRPV